MTTAAVDPRMFPDTSLLVTEDDTPVDNIYTEKQQRLLTEPLYSSWTAPDGKPFLALNNVGLFFAYAEPPLVPDMMLSLDVPRRDHREQDHRSYFSWIVGKMPEVVVEIVSDKRGGEETDKMRDYARLPVLHYVIYDPFEELDGGLLRVFALRGRKYQPIDPGKLPEAGLGLTLWTGLYEGIDTQWLRWCDDKGQLIPTGKERAEQEKQRAEQEKQRADRLAERLRQLGEAVD